MAKIPTNTDFASDAAKALMDLNAFAIVVSVLEGGHVHASSNEAARKIIAICKREQQRRLNDYDTALAKIKEPSNG